MKRPQTITGPRQQLQIFTIACNALHPNSERHHLVHALQQIRDLVEPDDDDEEDDEEDHLPLKRAGDRAHDRSAIAPAIALQLAQFITAANPAAGNKPQTIKCANCNQKMPFSGDIETDHHTMMRHHIEQCPRRFTAYQEHQKLIAEYAEQTRPLLSEAS